MIALADKERLQMELAQLTNQRPRSEIVSCTPKTPVRDVVALLAERRIGALPVVDGGRVVGIFSERDVIYRLAAEGDACLDRIIGEVMTSPVITVQKHTDLLDALSLMTDRRIRHLPVVEGEDLCGFISIGDLVKARLDEIQHEAEALRTYIQTA
jgi:CBS domain-containing protein